MEMNWKAMFEGTIAVFLENFMTQHAGEIRTMEVCNAKYLDANTKKWKKITEAYLTAQGGEPSYEGSYNFGSSGERFWMITSSYPTSYDNVFENISYMPQDTSHLKGFLSEFAEENNLDESLFKAILWKMDFERVQFEKDIKDFSGGQKKKVLIAKVFARKHIYMCGTSRLTL